jgi:hypothetical protein
MTNDERLASSFRDPSGFMFFREGSLYRQVNQSYSEDYDLLLGSGLYEQLVKAGRLIPHREVAINPAEPELSYKVIQPELVPFVSYPYEWSFGQLREAALATLAVQGHALECGLCLKDSSAYNMQFYNGKAALIDSLSFEKYREGEPWIAYRQFCQHFLAPLALMTYQDVRLGQLLRVYVDGIPLDLARRLLPRRALLDFGLFTHIFLHASAQRRYADSPLGRQGARKLRMSRRAMLGLMQSLKTAVRRMKWRPLGTEWARYYETTNYTDAAIAHKKQLVSQWVRRTNPRLIWDFGANTGIFSRLAGQSGAYVVAFDIDPAAVEQNYRQVKALKEKNVLPLLLDLTNPSPGIGWGHRERSSLAERGPVDMVLALALVHHLAISNNLPLPQLAGFFSDLCRWLIVEFVPRSDSQAQKLLRTREDIFSNYTQSAFELAFGAQFDIREATMVRDSGRCLYLMERRQ